MKAWLKGGLIGLGVGVSLSLLVYAGLFQLAQKVLGINLSLIFSLPFSVIINSILYGLFNFGFLGPESELVLLFRFSVPLGLCINGFMIGLVIGKIRSKNNVSKKGGKRK